MNSDMKTVELVKAHTAEFQVEQTLSNVEFYESMISTSEYTINVVDLMKRMHGNISVRVEVNHVAFFKNRDVALLFASLLRELGYWIADVKNSGNNQIEVSIDHRVDDFTVEKMAEHALCMTRYAKELDGLYGKWVVKEINGVIEAPSKHDRCVTDVLWHRYQKTYDSFATSYWYLYKPVMNFKYSEDEMQQDFYSQLDKYDVSDLMEKLRAQDGKIPVEYFPHFQDKHLKVVKEILTNRYYQENGDPDFTSTALKLHRMGSKKIAMEVGIYAIQVGEDYETFIGYAKEQDEDCDTNFASEFEKEKLHRELAVLHGERITFLSERVAWSETCFRRVEESGVIHMAKVIKQMVKELDMVTIKYNRLNAFVKAHLGEPPPDEGDQEGGGSQSPPPPPPPTLPPHLKNRFGR